MRNALETWLTAAEEVIEVAECEKHAKLESANNTLKEQEALMEKVIYESKVLQEEVEENSKVGFSAINLWTLKERKFLVIDGLTDSTCCSQLRQFLIDHGQIVDQLQWVLSFSLVLCISVTFINQSYFNVHFYHPGIVFHQYLKSWCPIHIYLLDFLSETLALVNGYII